MDNFKFIFLSRGRFDSANLYKFFYNETQKKNMQWVFLLLLCGHYVNDFTDIRFSLKLYFIPFCSVLKLLWDFLDIILQIS